MRKVELLPTPDCEAGYGHVVLFYANLDSRAQIQSDVLVYLNNYIYQELSYNTIAVYSHLSIKTNFTSHCKSPCL